MTLPARKPFELPTSVTIRFYPEKSGGITARVLDFDLAATARDQANALRKIRLCIRSYVEFGFLNGWAEDIRYPAPRQYWPPAGTKFETLEPIQIMQRSLLVYSESAIANEQPTLAHATRQAYLVAQQA
jgi:hypothetical protein